MRITLIQNDITWEHKPANLMYYDSLLSGLSGKTDLVVLPEMCTTGFSMKTAELAEYDDGETITVLSQMASRCGFAITGSFMGKGASPTDDTDSQTHSRSIGKKQATCFNRGFFLYPDGKRAFYNKRHLFRMGDETKHYQAGSDKLIVSYLGWNISLIVCYDLRFPVWSRNVDNEYDLLIVCANWPEPRRHAWESLLMARAIENLAYVCGVNRIGTDGMELHYTGDSQLINVYGTVLTSMESDVLQVQTVDIDLESLRRLRNKFPVWKDADRFDLRK
jgi:predicted amidohydrolase